MINQRKKIKKIDLDLPATKADLQILATKEELARTELAIRVGIQHYCMSV